LQEKESGTEATGAPNIINHILSIGLINLTQPKFVPAIYYAAIIDSYKTWMK
jgi:hypothetical protein